MAEYQYYCCGFLYDDSVDDLMRQPCPKCGTRNDPIRVVGIPASTKGFEPYRDRSSGVVVKSAKELRAIHDSMGLVSMDKREFQKCIEEPVRHEAWKQEQGLPAFEEKIPMPSVYEVKDGLERVRARLANDAAYRRRFDPKEPGFVHETGGPES